MNQEEFKNNIEQGGGDDRAHHQENLDRINKILEDEQSDKIDPDYVKFLGTRKERLEKELGISDPLDRDEGQKRIVVIEEEINQILAWGDVITEDRNHIAKLREEQENIKNKLNKEHKKGTIEIKEGIKTPEELIGDARNMSELKKNLSKIDLIKGTKLDYSPQDLIEIIDEVKEGKKHIGYITRRLGLREKVKELLDIAA